MDCRTCRLTKLGGGGGGGAHDLEKLPYCSLNDESTMEYGMGVVNSMYVCRKREGKRILTVVNKFHGIICTYRVIKTGEGI